MKRKEKQVKKKPAKKITALAVVEKTMVLTSEKIPFNQKQLLYIVQKTPTQYIYQRPAKGGGVWNYVEGSYIKKVLNCTFGWMWDFQIIDKGKEGDLVWVQGRLTVKNPKGEPMIIKEQFGRSDIKYKRATRIMLDYGNDLKAAATDSLKKCASELGIASDVYSSNEKKEVQEDKGKYVNEQLEVPTIQIEPEATKTNFVEQLKKMVGWTKEKDFSFCEKLFKSTGIQVDSFNKMSQSEARLVIAKLLMKTKK